MDRRLLLALFGLLATAALASAQSRSFCEISGNGSAKIDETGAVTASGRLISSEPTTERYARGRTDLYNGMICGFAGPCWNPSEKFRGRP
jgi:hypothetical protein